MMKRFFLLFVLFIGFVSESIFVDLIPLSFLSEEKIVVPHFIVVFLIAISAYTTQSIGIIYGFLFGFLYDVFYTEVVGIYTFTFPLLAYLTRKALKAFHNNVFVLFLLSLITISLLEFYTYGLYLLIGMTSMDINDFTNNRLLPTLAVNATVAILLIYPLKKFILSLQINENED